MTTNYNAYLNLALGGKKYAIKDIMGQLTNLEHRLQNIVSMLNFLI